MVNTIRTISGWFTIATVPAVPGVEVAQRQGMLEWFNHNAAGITAICGIITCITFVVTSIIKAKKKEKE